MTCNEVEPLLLDFLDGTLDEKSKMSVEQHLANCERCLDALQEYRQVLDTMQETPMEKPGESLRINFYHMLHSEMHRQDRKEKAGSRKQEYLSVLSYPIRLAAGIALLLTGALIGYFVHAGIQGKSQDSQVAQLSAEVNTMKEVVMFSMLRQESPSDRIQAVNYADKLGQPDDNVIAALVKTLNHDKNVNVRLAAAYSLARFSDRKPVIDSLVASLEEQADPIIQVTLMNILVERRERSAIAPIRKIISSDNTLKEVKNLAEKSLKVLI